MIKWVSNGVALSLLLASCGQPFGDTLATGEAQDAEESTGETQDELNVVIPRYPIDPRTEEEKERDRQKAESDLFGWTASLDGTDIIPCSEGVSGIDCRHAQRYPNDPRVADGMGAVVLAKANAKVVIRFSLKASWLHGDAYIKGLMKQYQLTPLDLVGAMVALEKLDKERSPVSPPASGIRTLDCPECGDNPPWSPFPQEPGDDHRGPAPGGTRPPPQGGQPGNPRPHGSGGTGVPAGRGGPGSPNPNAKWIHDREEGIGPHDPAPVPSPFDDGYWPKRSESPEDFKCEGHVYHGYQHACIDWKEMRDDTKVASRSATSSSARRTATSASSTTTCGVMGGGRSAETCDYFSDLECALVGTAGLSLTAICTVVTSGVCAALGPALAGALGGGATAGLSALCLDAIRHDCANNICIN